MHTLNNKYSLVYAAVMQIRGPSCVLLDEVHLTGCQPGILHCCAQPLELRKDAPGAGSSRVEGFKHTELCDSLASFYEGYAPARSRGIERQLGFEMNTLIGSNSAYTSHSRGD